MLSRGNARRSTSRILMAPGLRAIEPSVEMTGAGTPLIVEAALLMGYYEALATGRRIRAVIAQAGLTKLSAPILKATVAGRTFLDRFAELDRSLANERTISLLNAYGRMNVVLQGLEGRNLVSSAERQVLYGPNAYISPGNKRRSR